MRRIVLVLPLLFLCSCTSYFMQRADDLGDIVRFKATAGPGIALSAELTRGCILGGGISKVDAFGFANRSFGIWHETIAEGGVVLGFHREVCEGRKYYRGNYGFSAAREDDPYPFTAEDNAVDIWNVRATVHALIIGFDLEIRFGQIADFFTGIVGYDLAGDDYDFGPSRSRVSGDEIHRQQPSKRNPRGVQSTEE